LWYNYLIELSEKLPTNRKHSSSRRRKRPFHGLSVPLSHLRFVGNFDFSEGLINCQKGLIMQVAPSILSADFGHLARDVKAICDGGCDLVHVDVMDGHFVPNHTIGPVVVEAVSKVATKPLDIHLMVENNTFFVDLFAPLKPEYISFHIEEEKHPHRLIQKIRDLGIKPAIVLNPHTPPQSVEYLLGELDMVLLMSVNPGYGGQSFISTVIEKAKKLKGLISHHNPACLIEVDGGINDQNVKELADAGVDIVVAGSFIYEHPKGVSAAIAALK
jgi:ribulose-phosphate 3-epimerase